MTSVIIHKYSRFLYYLFLLFCFFPYIQLLPINTDSQPYALCIGLVALMIFGIRRLDINIFCLLVVALFSVIFLLFGVVDFNAIRSVVNYISLFVIASATYSFLTAYKKIPFGIFKWSVYIWCCVGVVQQFGWSSFCSFLISRASFGSSGSGRGMISLAPEPTFYAIICALLSLVCYLNFRNENRYRRLQWILWLQIVLLSRSSMMIMVSLMAVVCYYMIRLFRQRLKTVIGIIAAVTAICVILPHAINYLENYRIGVLLSKLYENPQLFVTIDESVNERFIHAFFPIYAFFSDFGFPHFYGSFSEYMQGIFASGNFDLYIPSYRDDYSRIMSGLGSALFELGFIALLIIGVLFHCVRRISATLPVFLFFGILLFFILLNAMPLSNGLVGFVFGNMIYMSNKIKTTVSVEDRCVKHV